VHARVATSYQWIARILRRVLERPDPDDIDTPEELRDQITETDPAKLVRDTLPSRSDILTVLCGVLDIDPATALGAASTATEGAAGSILATQPILRSDTDPANAEALLEKRARVMLREQKVLAETLNQVGEHLVQLLAGAMQEAHTNAVGDASSTSANTVARRYYHCFDLFDSVQYPMTFGTGIGEADVVEIIRVCPEDASALIPDVAGRRAKLRGLVAAHFGAFLDRAVSDQPLRLERPKGTLSAAVVAR